jgi:hypothetical protein
MLIRCASRVLLVRIHTFAGVIGLKPMSEPLYTREILEFIVGPPDRIDGSFSYASERLLWECGCAAAIGSDGKYRLVPCAEHRPEFDEEANSVD